MKILWYQGREDRDTAAASCWLGATILPSQGRKKLPRPPPLTLLAGREFHSHPLTFTSAWGADWGWIGAVKPSCLLLLPHSCRVPSSAAKSQQCPSVPLPPVSESALVGGAFLKINKMRPQHPISLVILPEGEPCRPGASVGLRAP